MKPTTPADLPEKVLRCIQLYTDPNTRVTKETIAHYCRLKYTANTDRQIRDAVTELRRRGEPICSTAGQAGYWYSYADLDIIIRDLKSRGREMFDTASVLERARRQHETKAIRQLELV